MSNAPSPFSIPAHDPGGTRLRLPAGVSATAVYGGPDDCYRYLLEWTWSPSLPTLCAGMMNPSCAGHNCGDRTVAWVHRWSVANGYGGMIVVNADAYRAADQSRLAEVADPFGPDNRQQILFAARRAATIVMGYGQPKVRAVRDHGPRMARLLVNEGIPLFVWGLSKDGTPKHPLYLPANTPIVRWVPRAG